LIKKIELCSILRKKWRYCIRIQNRTGAWRSKL